jgi:NADPH-dependent 2,4-dienoyl-CoA reductase/sulfur reductase-like enzyme
MEWVVQPYFQPKGCLKGLAAGVRSITDLPILTVGRINDPTIADAILVDGASYLVSMGRALIADPDLPNKAREGRFKEIRPCIACNVCIEAVGVEQTRCAVNAEMGREFESAPPTDTAKEVLVVGGGPAGMEAALRARSMGHRVKLMEAAETLGGQLVPAGAPDSKAEIRRLLDYQINRIEQSGIELKLGRSFDPEAAKAPQPDHVILATGAISREWSQGEGERVGKIIQAVEILMEGVALKGEVVVIGGGLVGLDVAEFLAGHGANVTILEMDKQAGMDLEWNVRKMKLKALKDKGVAILTKSRVIRVEDGRVVFINSKGSEGSLQTDAVVAALGSIPNNPFEKAIRHMGISVSCIGDCREPRGLAEAISEGFQVALNIGRS